jgi:nucleoside-diphosphate-sugar epimerase
MIYGRPGDRNVERLVRLVRRSPVIPLPGGGHGLQQPVHVDDLADAVVRCLERENTVGHSFDLAGPEPLTLRELVETTAAALGRTVRLVPVPLRAAVAGARVYERIRRQPGLRAEQLERLGEHKAFDISEAVDALGFGPRPFAEGMRLEVSLLR